MYKRQGVGGAATDPGPGPYPTVVCFHGMAMRIEPMIRWMSDLFDTPWAWLFLEAPYPVERKIGGVRTIGYAWYAFDGDTPAFRDSLRRSEARVLSLLPDRASAWNLDVTRMVVLGFSQGAYFAGSVGLRHAERFRGIVCAGGRIRPAYSGRSPETVPKLPILFLHGRDDATIPIEDARSAAEEMRGLGFPVEWRDVEGRHRWNPAMSEALRPWLSERFTEADPPGSR
ncbi:MAG: hypothetical protein QUU85_07230 [Candidatus Eisenbacteria bacterium]|nr:hypothetical protein [Candidatus Eisenbacteria bacterium]